MTSINTMVKRVQGLLDTHDLNDFEQNFVQSIVMKTRDGKDTSSLTEKQIEVLERLFKKHFAG